MKTEIDGDGRRWRQMKMKTTHSWDQQSGSFLIADGTPEWWRWRQTRIETGSLWGGAKWQLLYSWWHPWVTKTELDISPLMPPTDFWPHEGCSSLCSPRSSHGTAPVLSFLNLLSENVSYRALTVPSACANWSDRRPTKKFRRYGLN